MVTLTVHDNGKFHLCKASNEFVEGNDSSLIVRGNEDNEPLRVSQLLLGKMVSEAIDDPDYTYEEDKNLYYIAECKVMSGFEQPSRIGLDGFIEIKFNKNQEYTKDKVDTVTWVTRAVGDTVIQRLLAINKIQKYQKAGNKYNEYSYSTTTTPINKTSYTW
jgi:hypothetical protein